MRSRPQQSEAWSSKKKRKLNAEERKEKRIEEGRKENAQVSADEASANEQEILQDEREVRRERKMQTGQQPVIGSFGDLE